jgi:hypothetical protein
LVALVAFTALVFALDYVFGELFKNLFDTGATVVPAALGAFGAGA